VNMRANACVFFLPHIFVPKSYHWVVRGVVRGVVYSVVHEVGVIVFNCPSGRTNRFQN